MEAILDSPDETAPALMKVGMEAVEQDGQTRNVKGNPNEDSSAIQCKHHGALATDRYESIIPHADTEVRHPFVGDECRGVRKHSGRGSGGKNVIFQMVPIPFLGVLIYSTRCQYDVLKVLLKN